MAKRDDMLQSFLNNPLTSELCGLSREELSNISFSNSTDNTLIEALKKMITSAVEYQDPKVTTTKKVNTFLNDIK